jgi:hypothetical protein
MSFWIPRREPPTELPQGKVLPFRSLPFIFRVPGKGALPEAPSMEPLERALPHPQSPFIQLSKSPVDEPSIRFPKSEAPTKRDARLHNLF